MNLKMQMWLGLTGAFIMSGVDIECVDWEKEILRIIIPKRNYEWERSDVKIKTPEDYAKSVKDKIHAMGIFKNGRVLYKVKDVYWTKAMSEKAWQNFKECMTEGIPIDKDIDSVGIKGEKK